MTRDRRLRLLRTIMFGISLLLVAGSLFAQGGQTTGSIAGSVKANDGSLLPGVTITATSPVLQGSRVAYTGPNGDYILRGLPPGKYAVKFEMSGLGSQDKNVQVDLGGITTLDVALNPATKTETITVVASAPTALATTQLGSNYKSETIRNLPLPTRTLSNIAALTPGVNTNTPNGGQVRINGGFAYDNVFMVDGTDVNDNLFGTANNLYIEDAVAETQVMTGGVSAEYGRFSGGVVNAISKSGGNDFSGTLRTDFSNPAWTSFNPFETNPPAGTAKATRTHKLGEVYQGTLGGPVLVDKLWFFLAGRNTRTSTSASLPEFGSITQTTKNPRYEGKLTATPFNNHTIQGSYMTNNTDQGNNIPLGGNQVMDPLALVNRSLPNSRYALFYNGIITPSLFAEVRYSRKKFQFKNAGGTSTAITDSPLRTPPNVTPARQYNAPFFDAHDPEDRNNNDIGATLSYFLSTRSMGSHDLKGGYEFYRSTRTGGNSQTATGYVFFANPKRNSSGVAITDATGRYIPVWTPCVFNAARTGCTNVDATQAQNWLPTRGAKVDLDTKAAFINDTWNFSKHFSFNLGYRFENVTGSATGGTKTVDSSRGTPRLSASYDVKGDGRTKLDLSVSQYSGRYSEVQFARNTVVGNPSRITYGIYTGPAGEGVGFAPAFDLNNYQVTSGSFPTLNVLVDDHIKSPYVNELAFSLGQAITTNGFVKATYTHRRWHDFFEDFIGTAGFTHIGPPVNRDLDNTFYGNTDKMKKSYAAIAVLGQYRPLSRWTTQINYTRELKNDGNFVGEAANQPGNPSLFGDYPALYDETRNFPTGRLPGYEKDRIRWLNTFSIPLQRFGLMDLGLIYNYDSPLTFNYSAAVSLSAQQSAAYAAAGYKNAPPTSTTVFFGDRGAGTFRAAQSLDLALTYSLPLFGTRIAPWVKFEMTNVTNRDALINWNTTVIGDANSPKDALGLPTRYLRCGIDVPVKNDQGQNLSNGCGGITFGSPVSSTSYQTGRAWDWALGFRF